MKRLPWVVREEGINPMDKMDDGAVVKNQWRHVTFLFAGSHGAVCIVKYIGLASLPFDFGLILYTGG
jgi:hypothetical protein